MKRVPAVLGSAGFLVLAPGIVAGFVPWWISGWRIQPPFLGLLPFRALGILLMAAGVPILLESFGRFALQGFGTPAPVLPTRTLVVKGFYRYVRNPMYVAVQALILGQALLFGSMSLLAYGTACGLVMHVFVLGYEEPTLRRSFGAEYENYCAHVPRWLPRVRPWPIAAIAALLLASSCGASKPTCTNACLSAGATQCLGAQVQLCEQASNGCLQWGAAQPCIKGQFCSASQNACISCNPAAACPVAGATQCSGTQLETCAIDATGCLAWGTPTACPGTEACDGPQGNCASCTSSCTSPGSTQCVGDQVQTCTAGDGGCLALSAAATCPAGQICDPNQNACVDLCSLQDVLTLCDQAARQLTQCCRGSFAIPTSLDICRFLVAAQLDPRIACDDLASQACATLHTNGQQGVSPFPMPTCCCPLQEFCDLSAPNRACVPSCQAGADCPPGAPNCVPSVTDGGAIGSATMICSAEVAHLWRACDDTSLCCPIGSDCIQDLNSNQYCSPQCSATQPCGGDPAVACCLSIQRCQNCDAGVCAGTTYCRPCP